MGGYLSQRCESYYRQMKLTPMNTLLKLESSCITWLSLPLIVTSKKRKALGRKTQLLLKCLDTILYELIFYSQIFNITLDSPQSGTSSEIPQGTPMVPQTECLRFRHLKPLPTCFYIPGIYFFHKRHLCFHGNNQIWQSPSLLDDWMQLSEVPIFSERNSSDNAGIT